MLDHGTMAMMDDSEPVYPSQLATTKLLSNQRSPQKMRSKFEDEHDRNKRQLAMSSNKVWQTTGMPTVAAVTRKKNGKTIKQWHVCFLKYPTKATKKGERKKVGAYATEDEARAHIFEHRYDAESRASKQHVDALLEYKFGDNDEIPKSPPVNNKKRKSSDFDRSESFSANPAMRNRTFALPDMNPKKPGPFNVYNLEIWYQWLHNSATKIQHQWNRRVSW